MTVSIWTRNLKTGEIRKVIEGIKEIIKRNRTRKYTFGVKPNLFEIGPDFANTVIQSTVTEQQWNKVILKNESKPCSTSTIQNRSSVVLEEEEDENPTREICGTDYLEVTPKPL